MTLTAKKLLVGMTGGIACYKVPYLVRALRKAEAEVQVVMTANATRFIAPLTLEAVSNRQVLTEMFPEKEYVATRHIDFAEWADLIFIAPATANFIGKIANGICDDLLSTLICATPRRVMMAPAMNPRMWDNPITKKNIESLKDLGYLFIEPAYGAMACDHVGVGRMPEPEELLQHITDFFAQQERPKPLAGYSIVVTAGPCREPLDPVRYISNRSSGKMGYAIAEAARDAGAKVTLISGPTNLNRPFGVETIDVETTAQMHTAVSQQFPQAHCLIMAAAPADFTMEDPSADKIKRTEDGLALKLTPTVDILKTVAGGKKPSQLVVGFALETGKGTEEARRKMRDKHLDLLVLNNALEQGAGFDVDTNRVTFFDASGTPHEWPLESKRQVAERLVAELTTALHARSQPLRS